MKIKERFGRLEARERRMITLLGAVFLALLVVVLPGALAAAGSARRNEIEEMRRVLQRVEKSRPALSKMDAQNAAIVARYASSAPPLATLLDGLARAQSLDVPESQDLPPVPHGKHYDERTTKVVLRKVNLLPMVKFLEQIDNSGHAVCISRLNLRRRTAEPDSYDAEIVVSAFDSKNKPVVPVKVAVPEPAAADSTSNDEGDQ